MGPVNRQIQVANRSGRLARARRRCVPAATALPASLHGGSRTAVHEDPA